MEDKIEEQKDKRLKYIIIKREGLKIEKKQRNLGEKLVEWIDKKG